MLRVVLWWPREGTQVPDLKIGREKFFLRFYIYIISTLNVGLRRATPRSRVATCID